MKDGEKNHGEEEKEKYFSFAKEIELWGLKYYGSQLCGLPSTPLDKSRQWEQQMEKLLCKRNRNDSNNNFFLFAKKLCFWNWAEIYWEIGFLLWTAKKKPMEQQEKKVFKSRELQSEKRSANENDLRNVI